MFDRYCSWQLWREGGESRVYLAVDRFTKQECLIKTGAALHEEAYRAKSLIHPYIVAPYDIGVHADFGPFAVYPRVSGQPLNEAWEELQTEEEQKRVARQLFEVLMFLHQNDWLYNDFKPEHFLIRSKDIQVLDFGLCSRLHSARESFYGGTFPCISPERLLGRKRDQRSDLFSAGMMFLSLLNPSAGALQPSLEALYELHKTAKTLNGFWGKLICSLTALEPAQRPQSAAEVWKKLSGRRSTPLLPPPRTSCLPDGIWIQSGPQIIETPSLIFARDLLNEWTITAWKNGFSTTAIDLSRSNFLEFFGDLATTISGQRSSDFYTDISILAKSRSDRKIAVAFVHAELLGQKELALLSYAISTLGWSDQFHFCVFSFRHKNFGMGDWRIFRPPLLGKREVLSLATSLITKSNKRIIAGHLAEELDHCLPEQVVARLQQLLSRRRGNRRVVNGHLTYEKLTVYEKRALAALAVADCRLPISTLRAINRNMAGKFDQMMDRLVTRGFIGIDSDDAILLAESEDVLARCGPYQLRRIATMLLKSRPQSMEVSTIFHIMKQTGNVREAGDFAKKQASLSGSFDWLYHALSCGVQIPGPVMLKLARHLLARSDFPKAQTVLRSLRATRENKYEVADLLLDWHHRKNELAKAASLSSRVADAALKRGNSNREEYFRIRNAGFLILDGQLEDGFRFLNGLNLPRMRPARRGLVHHFLGLYHLYKGELKLALKQFNSAV